MENFFPRGIADVMSVHNRNMKHARAIEFDYTNLLCYKPLYVTARYPWCLIKEAKKCEQFSRFLFKEWKLISRRERWV